MPPISLKTRFLTSLSGLVIASMLSTGCSDDQPQAPAETEISTASYQVRGEIMSLPSADKSLSSLNIRHEAIPDFVDGQGKTVGMDAMRMPFPPAEGLNLSEFSVGDKVLVTFEVTWGGQHNGWEATALSPLPADTELDFTTPAKPRDEHAGHDHSSDDHSTQDDHSGHAH